MVTYDYGISITVSVLISEPFNKYMSTVSVLCIHICSTVLGYVFHSLEYGFCHEMLTMFPTLLTSKNLYLRVAVNLLSI